MNRSNANQGAKILSPSLSFLARRLSLTLMSGALVMSQLAFRPEAKASFFEPGTYSTDSWVASNTFANDVRKRGDLSNVPLYAVSSSGAVTTVKDTSTDWTYSINTNQKGVQTLPTAFIVGLIRNPLNGPIRKLIQTIDFKVVSESATDLVLKFNIQFGYSSPVGDIGGVASVNVRVEKTVAEVYESSAYDSKLNRSVFKSSKRRMYRAILADDVAIESIHASSPVVAPYLGLVQTVLDIGFKAAISDRSRVIQVYATAL